MTPLPRWFRPLVLIALVWNLLGCAAYLADVRRSPDELARLSEPERTLQQARPAWALAGTAVAVWSGALGCIGLLLRRRWAMPALWLSLAGVLVQDLHLLRQLRGVPGLAPAGLPTPVLALQGLVLLVAVGLVLLSIRAIRQRWMR